MSDIPPGDGRLGGEVPLQRLEDLNPTVTDPVQVPTGGPLFPDPIVEGEDLTLRLASGEEVPIDQLPLDVVEAAIQDISAQGLGDDTGFRLPIVGGGGVGAPFQGTGFQNPLPQSGPARNLLRALSDQQGVLQQQQQEDNIRNQEFDADLGPSHPERSGRSLASIYYAEGNTSVFRGNLLTNVQGQADIHFDTQIGQLSSAGREEERVLRNAIVDIQAFEDSLADGQDVFSDEELQALKGSYEARIEGLRISRSAARGRLESNRSAVLSGDLSSLPDYLQLNDAQEAQIEFEAASQQQTGRGYERWQSFAQSNSLADRMITESVRGYVNGTYSGLDVLDLASWNMPIEELTAILGDNVQPFQLEAAGVVDGSGAPSGFAPLIDNDTRNYVIEQVADILGLERDLIEFDNDNPRFDPAWLTREQLEAMDSLAYGIRDSRAPAAQGLADFELASRQLADPDSTLFSAGESERGFNFDLAGDEDNEDGS